MSDPRRHNAKSIEDLERDIAFLAQMLRDELGHAVPSEHERLREMAARYPRFDAEEVEPTLGPPSVAGEVDRH